MAWTVSPSLFSLSSAPALSEDLHLLSAALRADLAYQQHFLLKLCRLPAAQRYDAITHVHLLHILVPRITAGNVVNYPATMSTTSTSPLTSRSSSPTYGGDMGGYWLDLLAMTIVDMKWKYAVIASNVVQWYSQRLARRRATSSRHYSGRRTSWLSGVSCWV